MAADAETAPCPNAAIRGQQGAGFLPDCRAYEMVSPVEKSGNQAVVDGNGNVFYSRAAGDGNAITYYTTGPVGDAVRGLQAFTTGTRTPSGWTNRAAIPGPEAGVTITVEAQLPQSVQISPDASHVAFSSGTYVDENPAPPIGNAASSAGAYLTSPDGPLQWLNRPLVDSASPRPGQLTAENGIEVAGGSTDFGTIYFSYCGTLTAADAPRAGRLNHGFYVSEGGAVATAGTLPNGSVDPDGAVSADLAGYPCQPGSRENDPTSLGNPISEDGTRAQFVSPDPAAGSSRPSELYQHRQDGSTVLVSRSEITGEPASSGIVNVGHSFGPASSSGRFIVFGSTDRLTVDAPAVPTLNLYRFDADTGELELLDGLESPSVVLGVSNQGAVLAMQIQEGEAPVNGDRVLLWDQGEAQLVGIASLGGRGNSIFQPHFSADGQTLIFDASRPFVGGVTNQPDGTREIYRYVLGQSGLPECISCLPEPDAPTGPAFLSHLGEGFVAQPYGGGGTIAENRDVSPDGRQIFFDTPDALVPADTNGKRDVYEWFDGRLSLISTGRSDRNSVIVDSSVSTGDVFFATTEGLVPEDEDEAYDLYDARVGGGFAQADVRTCGGESCLDETGAQPSLPTVASKVPLGAGNVARSSKANEARARARARAQKLHKALRRCKAKRVKGQRKQCRAAAHKHFKRELQAERNSR